MKDKLSLSKKHIKLFIAHSTSNFHLQAHKMRGSHAHVSWLKR